MADNVKIGKFIKEERKKLSLSQEEFASKLGVTRQAVSRWEQGICLPDYCLVSIICEIFKITANEFLVGERIKKENEKEINNISIKILKTEKQKRKRLFITLFSIIIVLLLSFFSFLIFYFFNTYKKVEVYMVSGATEKFNIYNSLMVVTNDKTYINLSGLKTNNVKDIKEVYLYFLKDDKERKIISNSCQNYCSPEQFAITIIQRKGGNEYFEYSDLDMLKENLYIRITYLEDDLEKEETFKLCLIQNYVNENLFFHYKDERDLESSIIEDNNFKDKLKEKVINEGFKFQKEKNTGNDVYVKNGANGIKVKVYLEPNTIIVENSNDSEWLIFDYRIKEYRFSKYEDGVIIKDSTMFNGEVSCPSFDCQDDIDYYNYYIDKYISPLIDF